MADNYSKSDNINLSLLHNSVFAETRSESMGGNQRLNYFELKSIYNIHFLLAYFGPKRTFEKLGCWRVRSTNNDDS